MKLKEYNKETCRRYQQKRATLQISSDGKISFNLRAATILNLKEYPNVTFLQDEDNLQNWYVKVEKEGKGFLTKEYRTHGRNFYSRALATNILQSVNSGVSCKFIVSPHLMENSDLYPIITHSKTEVR